MQVLDHQQARPARARIRHQLGDRLPPAPLAALVVHGVVERVQLDGLRQIEQVVEIDPVLVRDQAFAAARAAAGSVAAGPFKEAADERADRVLAGAGAEVEH